MQNIVPDRSGTPPHLPGTLLTDLLEARVGWIVLIKAVRQAYGVGIFEAEALALTHPGWRHWCDRRLAADPACRKLARAHIKRHGTESLVAEEEGLFRVR